jgi:hypothetical protein
MPILSSATNVDASGSQFYDVSGNVTVINNNVNAGA